MLSAQEPNFKAAALLELSAKAAPQISNDPPSRCRRAIIDQTYISSSESALLNRRHPASGSSRAALASERGAKPEHAITGVRG